MIRVICNQETFVYNAYHMVKAFYPSETVASSVDEKASNYVTVEFAEDGTDGQKEAMIEIADIPECSLGKDVFDELASEAK